MEGGRLAEIWVKRFRGGPMDPVEVAELEAGLGIAGNANRGGRRQVTLLEREVWDSVMHALGAALPASARRANLLLESTPLARTYGRILRIGSARVRILGPTQPCNRMEETWPGLEAALRPAWRGGAFAEVLDGGRIRRGDPVEWEG